MGSLPFTTALSNARPTMLSDVVRIQVKNERELYCIYLGCKGEIDILVCKKCPPPINDLNLKWPSLKKGWTSVLSLVLFSSHYSNTFYALMHKCSSITYERNKDLPIMPCLAFK